MTLRPLLLTLALLLTLSLPALGEGMDVIQWATPTPTLTPTPSPTPTPTPAPTPTPTPAPTVKVGDVVTFGHYEQDGISGNGYEPIQWTVIDTRGSTALLLSVQGLDTRPYHSGGGRVTWAESSLRQWLNDDFIYAAFDTAEAGALLSTPVTADPNPYYPSVPAGSDTLDRVFLLSVTELEHYLPYEDQRFCYPTQYAIDKGAHENSKTGRCRWWLRSPGEDARHAANVFTSGEYWDDYFKTGASGLCLRPAIWVQMTGLV